ncbi:MAG: rRNA maturation RNase YbeY [Firmicutes bacterium]|nr:rRNA maturation RNase YbeY [Bacillota bacterium]
MAVLVADLQDVVKIPAEQLLLLEEVGNLALRLEGKSLACEVSVVLVDNDYIQELNFTYRGSDCPTDVLSFNLQDNNTALEEEEILGDVIISVEKAQEQAHAYGHTLQREIAFLAIHGILHLLGYDHDTIETEQEMSARKELILKKFKL